MATAPFRADRHHQYTDPAGADVGALLADILTRTAASTGAG
ncbi:hypothetical protein [Streptomyces microflavus]